MTRASWQDTWLEVAFAIAKRSSCTNRQVGCVIVDTTNRPVATGYNGPPGRLRRRLRRELFKFLSSFK
jgi:deoxycytidylate deaminase